MSADSGKAKEIEPEVKPVELSEEALEQVAGGASNPTNLTTHKDNGGPIKPTS
jgi:hypothetical protein